MIVDMSADERHLYVAQQFGDRSIRPVARLSIRRVGGTDTYEFVYLKAIRGHAEFSPFLAFPAVGHR
jgi:hypothetical protein